MDTIGFFTSEERSCSSQIQAPVTKPLLFPREEDIRKMKELMKRVVALDCYGRDKNGINGLLRNIDTALIATLRLAETYLGHRPSIIPPGIEEGDHDRGSGAEIRGGRDLDHPSPLEDLRLVCPEHCRQLGEFPSFAFLVCRGRTCDLAYDRRPPLPHAYGKTDARG